MGGRRRVQILILVCGLFDSFSTYVMTRAVRAAVSQ